MTTFNLSVSKITFLALTGAVSAVLLQAGSAFASTLLLGDSTGDPSLQKTGSISGAIFEWVSNDIPAGTGVLNSFLRIQHNGDEKGYNTDGQLEFDAKAGKFTHSLQLSNVPLVQIGGQAYRQFILDVNEPNAKSKPDIVLDSLQFFLGSSGNLTGYSSFGGNAVKVFDLDSPEDNAVQVFDTNSGSGRYDLLVNILDSKFNLGGGSQGGDPYVYLYSKFTGAEGGFEEWAVQPPAAAVPTPALLPGLVGLGLGIWRKRKDEQASAEAEG